MIYPALALIALLYMAGWNRPALRMLCACREPLWVVGTVGEFNWLLGNVARGNMYMSLTSLWPFAYLKENVFGGLQITFLISTFN